jgi:Holliday junction DNA helicase RuvA
MIGRISGLLLEKFPPLVLVDVQGVGYEIDVPMSTFYNLPAVGTQITLHTHFVVREDVHLLFGFATEDERQAFRQLVKISGVGARTALALLSGLSVADLHQAVSAIPGATGARRPSTMGSDVLNALLSLGYNDREAHWAVRQLSVDLSVSDGIKQALKLLSKEK